MSRETYAALQAAIAAHLGDLHAAREDSQGEPSMLGEWILAARVSDASGASGYSVEFSADTPATHLAGLVPLLEAHTHEWLDSLVWRGEDGLADE